MYEGRIYKGKTGKLTYGLVSSLQIQKIKLGLKINLHENYKEAYK